MKKVRAKVAANKKAAPGFYRMAVASAYLAKSTKPGQFFEVKCPSGYGAFLRRPLGAHRITAGGVEMLYEIVGKGTSALSAIKPGEELDIMGPLGNGFDIPKKPRVRNILVAGGIGVAPLVALAESLGKKGNVTAIIGACSKSHVLCESDMKKAGAKVMVATEDGSKGRKGLVTLILEKVLADTREGQDTAIYACGPVGMLKAVSEIAGKRDIPCQVSMEEHMACGIGVCLGCPVKTESGGYKMVCKDGPVFNAEDIAW